MYMFVYRYKHTVHITHIEDTLEQFKKHFKTVFVCVLKFESQNETNQVTTYSSGTNKKERSLKHMYITAISPVSQKQWDVR